jgi:hypothetical protein
MSPKESNIWQSLVVDGMISLTSKLRKKFQTKDNCEEKKEDRHINSKLNEKKKLLTLGKISSYFCMKS